MLQFIPENLDLAQVLLDHPPDFQFHIDYFIHILHLITEIPANNKDLLDADSDFVPLNSTVLRKRIDVYHPYLNYLVERGILQTDNQYIVGEKSKGYRFSPTYQTAVTERTITKYTLIKKISHLQRQQNRRAEEQHHDLRQFFNSKLLIDHAGAVNFLQQTYRANLENKVKNAIGKYNAGILQVARLRDQNFFFHVDHTVNRLHTNLTTCNSGIRDFLTYDGQQLVSVDLRNSQPFLSTLVLSPNFYKRIPHRYFNIYNISPHINSSTIVSIINNIMWGNNELSIDSRGFADVKLYVEKVLEGTLYDYIAAEVQKRHGIVYKSRKQLKAMIFMVLFSDNRFIGQRDAEPKRIFRELFPNVYKVFKAIKKHGSNNLPIMLQRMESKFILDYVAKRIMIEKPGMPLFTIHDSIVCPLGQESYVAYVIHDESQRHLGVQPNLHYEFWRPRVMSTVQVNQRDVYAA